MRREGEGVHTHCTRTAVARDSRNFVRFWAIFSGSFPPFSHVCVCHIFILVIIYYYVVHRVVHVYGPRVLSRLKIQVLWFSSYSAQEVPDWGYQTFTIDCKWHEYKLLSDLHCQELPKPKLAEELTEPNTVEPFDDSVDTD